MKEFLFIISPIVCMVVFCVYAYKDHFKLACLAVLSMLCVIAIYGYGQIQSERQRIDDVVTIEMYVESLEEVSHSVYKGSKVTHYAETVDDGNIVVYNVKSNVYAHLREDAYCQVVYNRSFDEIVDVNSCQLIDK